MKKNNTALKQAMAMNQSTLKVPFLIATVVMLLVAGVIYWRVDQGNQELAAQVYAAAQDAYRADDYEQALALVDEALLHYETAEYLVEKYTILVTLKQYSEAIVYLDKALAREPNNALYQYKASQFYAQWVEDFVKAKAYLEKAMALDPNNTTYKWDYSYYLIKDSRYDEAIKMLEKMIEADPEYDEARNLLTTAYKKNNQPEKALDLLIKATRLFPESAYHWQELGVEYDLIKKVDKAVEAYQKSIDLSPETGTDAAHRISALTGKKVPEQYRIITEDNVPVKYKNTHPYIQATVAGHLGVFLLDTGATDTFLFQEFLDKNELTIVGSQTVGNYVTASGVITAPVFNTSVKVGRFSPLRLRVGVIPNPDPDDQTDGIIGMNFMQNFNIRMDNLKHTLVFSKK